MSHARVRNLFSAALAAYASTKGSKVSYDNVLTTFTSDVHIRSHLMPVDTFSDTLSGDHKGFTGLYQMTVVTKTGIGTLSADSVTDDLQAIFEINRRFVDSNGFAVQVTTPLHTHEGKQIDGEWVLPCYFSYRADTN